MCARVRVNNTLVQVQSYDKRVERRRSGQVRVPAQPVCRLQTSSIGGGVARALRERVNLATHFVSRSMNIYHPWTGRSKCLNPLVRRVAVFRVQLVFAARRMDFWRFPYLQSVAKHACVWRHASATRWLAGAANSRQPGTPSATRMFIEVNAVRQRKQRSRHGYRCRLRA